MNRFGIQGTVRASFAFYNTKEEVDLLIVALKRAINMLS
jgi:cysteine desulfurase/selenocysteine lyase